MMTITCKLTFKDGRVLTARITAASPEAEYPVRYEGPAERLQTRPTKSDAGFLEFLMKSAAVQAGAILEIDKQGEFERFAE